LSVPGAAITRLVQAGVDVAIATKMLTLVCEGVLDVLFLVAGDGDFLEALKYIADTRHKKVYLAGFHGMHALAGMRWAYMCTHSHWWLM
jgi:uncharacterized LabA/DUF88 family protein